MKTEYGKFITIEGIEGVGKSTACAFIREFLQKNNITFIETREPGGTQIAEEMRDILLKHHAEILTPEAELLLFFAGRAQNIAEVIRPALQQGTWVIADRFVDASFAYQGGGRGVANTQIEQLAEFIVADLAPDLTLLLDAPVEIGFERMRDRESKDRIEQEQADFFERVRRAYLDRAAQCTPRIQLIDASKTVRDVQDQISHVMMPLIQEYQQCRNQH